LAFVIVNEDNQADLWVRDLDRGTETRLTTDGAFEFFLMWLPSGNEIVFSRFLQDEGVTVRRVAADGSSAAALVVEGLANGLSPDGRTLVLFRQIEGEAAATSISTPTDIWLVPLDGSDEARPIIQSPARDVPMGVSPDGRFLAYTSDQSGRRELYLTRYPQATGRWQISVNGAAGGYWDPAGGRIYFLEDATFMEVTVEDGAEPRLGKPVPLFDLPADPQLLPPRFSVAKNGERFVALDLPAGPEDQEPGRSGIKIVENWIREYEN